MVVSLHKVTLNLSNRNEGVDHLSRLSPASYPEATPLPRSRTSPDAEGAEKSTNKGRENYNL